MKDYILIHDSWPSTICSVCGNQTGVKKVMEIHKVGPHTKQDRWTFICEDCLTEIKLFSKQNEP